MVNHWLMLDHPKCGSLYDWSWNEMKPLVWRHFYTFLWNLYWWVWYDMIVSWSSRVSVQLSDYVVMRSICRSPDCNHISCCSGNSYRQIVYVLSDVRIETFQTMISWQTIRSRGSRPEIIYLYCEIYIFNECVW